MELVGVEGYGAWAQAYDQPGPSSSTWTAHRPGDPGWPAARRRARGGLRHRPTHRVPGRARPYGDRRRQFPRDAGGRSGKDPGAEFRERDLHQLPVPDQCVNMVVCALSLTRVPEPGWRVAPARSGEGVQRGGGQVRSPGPDRAPPPRLGDVGQVERIAVVLGVCQRGGLRVGGGAGSGADVGMGRGVQSFGGGRPSCRTRCRCGPSSRSARRRPGRSAPSSARTARPGCRRGPGVRGSGGHTGGERH